MLPDDFDPRDPLSTSELCVFILVVFSCIIALFIYLQVP